MFAANEMPLDPITDWGHMRYSLAEAIAQRLGCELWNLPISADREEERQDPG